MRVDGFGLATRRRDKGVRLLRPRPGLREDGWKHGQCGGGAPNGTTIIPKDLPPLGCNVNVQMH